MNFYFLHLSNYLFHFLSFNGSNLISKVTTTPILISNNAIAI